MSKLANIQNKIFSSVDTLKKQVQAWQGKGLNVVFTNGCFDILHQGHVSYLAQGAELGDKLIVALNTDKSVKNQGKSPNRPLQNEQSRAMVMASLGFVDAVVLFDEDTPLNLIKSLMPNTLVKGADYSIEQIVGAKEVIANGGSVKTIDLVAGFSTTSIEQKILNQG